MMFFVGIAKGCSGIGANYAAHYIYYFVGTDYFMTLDHKVKWREVRPRYFGKHIETLKLRYRESTSGPSIPSRLLATHQAISFRSARNTRQRWNI